MKHDKKIIHNAVVETELQRKFWTEHRQEYLETYPNMFVGVRDGIVVGTHESVKGLVELLESKGIPALGTWIKYFDTEQLPRVCQ